MDVKSQERKMSEKGGTNLTGSGSYLLLENTGLWALPACLLLNPSSSLEGLLTPMTLESLFVLLFLHSCSWMNIANGGMEGEERVPSEGNVPYKLV